ncbi:hypothetical protein Palpr_1435 [Paludibacter propionicigenes WB4]|uniref:HEPN domain-containing protein n=1 Tax=Paludibacter propionicigenes (strain DSM 17365 / JCM 13257 / WB4) TaxID=694427 RepID=E4T4D7_PALPW|nr:hypothetical protein [Paludibacter propionicigenes]ADQ79581.1 hypothetical protein Palpr_1435 [Paludibacter propionicigenes WB4]
MSTTIIPDDEMKALAISSLRYANSFFSTFQKSLNNEKSRFDNDLLYNFAVMSVEKYFVALLARFDWNAEHHMPIALYKEALPFEPELTEEMKQTAILIGKFEAICSLDGFGYRTPSTEELEAMASGIASIKNLVEKRIAEVTTSLEKIN